MEERILHDLARQVTDHHGYKLVYGSLPEGVRGRTSTADKVVKLDLAQLAPGETTTKVLAHELAHIELDHSGRHGRRCMECVFFGSCPFRQLAECEAELAATLVVTKFGGHNPILGDYLQNWSEGNPAIIQEALTEATAGAERIIERMVA